MSSVTHTRAQWLANWSECDMCVRESVVPRKAELVCFQRAREYLYVGFDGCINSFL